MKFDSLHSQGRKPLFSAKKFLVSFALSTTAAAFCFGCGGPKAAPAPPAPEVEVTTVIQKDVPIYGEWVATLDGYVNAQIQPQVSGYIVQQNYKEGSYVRKGQTLFRIDPRPFQAVLDQAKAQLAQAEAQLGKTQLDVDRDTPLAKERAIAQSQLDNDIQANLAAKAAVKAAEAQVEQAELNMGFTNVTSLVDGIAGIAQVQIGNLVNQSAVLTAVSQVDPIKAYFPISEQEYMHFAERINTHNQQEYPSDAPPFDLILADGTTYPQKGRLLLTDRQVDITTGSIRIVCAFPNPKNILRPGQFGRVRAAGDVRLGALLVPQRAVTELQGSYQVFVVGADGKANVRAVTVGERVGTMWIVESGLKAGENVVVEGVQKIRDGVPVRVKASGSAAKGN
ncbi:MAG TPA: efflux RND transporter periplasmic adaptor subunit [Candidatus Dormibacteraeota bacterium]|jgi:RND family efflux transporter MFP subunit|nr:efflux RND transporter periplasmic adaptor subunit [Candidatus Dormibacteraeota bacterium]